MKLVRSRVLPFVVTALGVLALELRVPVLDFRWETYLSAIPQTTIRNNILQSTTLSLHF